jgi:DNA-binding CsgD family transcriptional regulator
MMRSQIPVANRKPSPESQPAARTPDELLRLLVSQLPLASSPEQPSSGARALETDEVMFDAEIDGYRYFLVRAPKTTHSQVFLSPREKEIVRMVAQGHPNKIIAAVLNISSWTVCTHLRRVFAKMGVGSRAAMVARLLEIGAMRSGSPPARVPQIPGHLAGQARPAPSEKPQDLARNSMPHPGPAASRRSA